MENKISENRRRTKTIKWTFRISPNIKAIMLSQSKLCGKSMSEYIRDLVELDLRQSTFLKNPNNQITKQ